ncbi:MAG: hypothetical protein AB7R90_02755 [Reyranellaceae bacterium]
MKPIRSLALALALGGTLSLGAVSLAAAQGSWQKVEGPNGLYSAKLPGTPTPDTQTYDSNNGPVTVSSYRAEANQGHFAVGTITYEKRLNRTPVQILDDVRNGVVARSRGTLASEKPVAMQGAQGRELVYSVKNDQGTYHVRQRFYVAAPNRIVQVAYVGAPGTEMAPAVDEFMNSVSLAKQ